MSSGRMFVPALLIFVAGCGGGSGKPPEQIVAKGTEFEVTVSELDQLLKTAPLVSEEQVVPARRAILNALVSQKLLAKAAIDQQLDRDPNVMQAIEAARRSILAEAYADRIAPRNRQPSDREIEAFYQNNPQLFAARRVVVVDEVVLPTDTAALERYRAIFDKDGLGALVSQLNAEEMTIRRGSKQLVPEELPPATLERLLTLKVDDAISYVDNGNVHLGVITAIDMQPLNLASSRALIIPRMAKQRRDEILRTEAARLRKEHQVVTFEAKLGAKRKAAQ